MDLSSRDGAASVRTARMREVRRLAARLRVSGKGAEPSINTRRSRDATYSFRQRARCRLHRLRRDEAERIRNPPTHTKFEEVALYQHTVNKATGKRGSAHVVCPPHEIKLRLVGPGLRPRSRESSHSFHIIANLVSKGLLCIEIRS